jgi:hypothetical protein
MEVIIISNKIKSKDIKYDLGKYINLNKENISLSLQPRNLKLRNIDPLILIASINVIPSIGILIKGLLNIVKEKQLQKISIVTKSGIKIEVPANIPSKKLDEVIAKIKTLEIETLNLEA